MMDIQLVTELKGKLSFITLVVCMNTNKKS